MLMGCEIGLVWHLCASWQRPSFKTLGSDVIFTQLCVHTREITAVLLIFKTKDERSKDDVFRTNAKTKPKFGFKYLEQTNLQVAI